MDEFYENIFKKWVTTNQLSQNDVIPILLEYNNLFGTKALTPQEINIFLGHPIVQGYINILIINALNMIGVKKEYSWITITDKNNRFIRRYIN